MTPHATKKIWKKFRSHNWLVHEINKKCTHSVLKYIQGFLLDIGCGEKPYLDIINTCVKNYIGLEHPNSLHINSKIDIYGNGCNLPFKNNSFDTVVSFQVLEHINEPNKMLSKVYRVLKNDKYFIITTPFMWGIHEEPFDFYRYTRYGLKYLLEKNGFEVIEIRANSGYWIMSGLRFNYYLTQFEKSCFKYLLSPIYFFVQIFSWQLDKTFRVESDTISYTTIVRKR